MMGGGGCVNKCESSRDLKDEREGDWQMRPRQLFRFDIESLFIDMDVTLMERIWGGIVTG